MLNSTRKFLPVIPGLFQTRSFSCSFAIQKLCEIVSTVGSLDDMETSLDESSATHTIITPGLVAEVMDRVARTEVSSRRLLRFFSWARQKNSKFGDWDEIFNDTIRVLAHKKDLTAVDILIKGLRKERRQMETETFCCLAEALVRLGREDDAVGLFKNLEKFRCPQDAITLSATVHALCSRGHAKKAQGILWHHRHKLSLPVEPCLYRALLHGWCANGNVKEARTILEDMKSFGLSPGLSSFNTFLRCLCMRNLRYNPSALVPDATSVMAEMRSCGVSPTTVSFNILLSCLGKVRRVKEACRILNSMQDMGSQPDWMTYYLVARVLFLTGRLSKGKKVVDLMIGAGVTPQARFYHGLIALLCGIKKVDVALDMFEQMKKSDSCFSEEKSWLYGRVYDLLIPMLCRGGNFIKGRDLWEEALERGVTLQCSSDLLDSSKTEVFMPMKKVETLRLEDSMTAMTARNVNISKMKNKRKKKKMENFAS